MVEAVRDQWLIIVGVVVLIVAVFVWVKSKK